MDIIVPFSQIVDSETRAVINDLKFRLAKADEEARNWRFQATRAQEAIDSHKEEMDTLKSLKEKLEPFTRDLMEFLRIYEADPWG